MRHRALGAVAVAALFGGGLGCGGGGTAAPDGGGGTGGVTAGPGGGGSGGGAMAGTGGTAGGAAAGAGGGAGSGGSATGVTCDGTAPCGGDVVGTWTFVSACLNEAAINERLRTPGCPDAVITNVGSARSGSVVFTATDYTLTMTNVFSYTETFSGGCNGMTCDEFAAYLSQDGNLESSSCSGTAICTCARVYLPRTISQSGTYTTSGSTLTLTATGAGPNESDYCVQGAELHLLDIERVVDMGSIRMRTLSDLHARRP